MTHEFSSKGSRLDPQAASRLAGRPVRIVMPAAVAFDLDRFQSAVANLAERLGCKPCLSGAACIFLMENEFVVNPAGEIEAGGVMFLEG
jgi:hypothetical protein